ncbi:MAG: pentapeptide repeat-containing protein [Erysipelotrichaceae bacterium]|nr:pentapeptide repeat-containing protein [Erysipelotrichaceae bacterium]
MNEILEEYNIKKLGYEYLNISILQKLNRRQLHKLSNGESCLITEDYANNRDKLFLKNTLFKKMAISDTRIEKAVFINCKYEDVSIKDTSFSNGIFMNCYFESTTFTGVDLDYAVFIGCLFKDTFVMKCKLNYAEFYESNYSDLNIVLDKTSPDYTETLDIKVVNNNSYNERTTKTIIKEENKMEILGNIVSEKEFDESYTIENNVIYDKCIFNSSSIKDIKNNPEFKDCTFKNMTFGYMYKISMSKCKFISCSFYETVKKCYFDYCDLNGNYFNNQFEFCNFTDINVSDELLKELKDKSKHCYFSGDSETIQIQEVIKEVEVVKEIEVSKYDPEFEKLIEPIYLKFQENQTMIQHLTQESQKKPSIKEYVNSLNDNEKWQFMQCH